jgi:hypothetical protein
VNPALVGYPEVRQFDKFEATFSPRNRESLRPSAVPEIGERFVFQALWVIDGGEFDGEWAMGAISEPLPAFAWVPLSDLIDIRPAPVADFLGGESPDP